MKQQTLHFPQRAIQKLFPGLLRDATGDPHYLPAKMGQRILACLIFCFLIALNPASAAPPIWENDFGAELGDLTGLDDEETDVTLSFPFPFEGTTYTTVYVGTNGGLQLGGDGDDDDIDYDVWEDLDEFYDDGGEPTIFPFNTDLELATTGTIHFNDFGDRAVFTWNEVGAFEERTHLVSFQVQLLANGQIIFAYNGIFDGPGEDLIDSLSEGIVVGISESTDSDPGVIDFSDVTFSTTEHTIYEVWNYEDPPENTLFDLDMTNLVFTPNVGGGFTVSGALVTVVPPALRITAPPRSYRYRNRLTVRGRSNVPLSSLQAKWTGRSGFRTTRLGGSKSWRVNVPRSILRRKRAVTVSVRGKDALGNTSSIVKRRYRRAAAATATPHPLQTKNPSL